MRFRGATEKIDSPSGDENQLDSFYSESDCFGDCRLSA